MTDPYVGRLTYLRVYSGVLHSGLARPRTRRRTARSASAASSRCTRTTGRTRTRRTRATSSPSSGCSTQTTGDTLCEPDHPIVLEKITFPTPVISVAVEPKTKADQDKLGRPGQALRRGPDVRRAVRRRDRPDGDLGHGRAAPRHHRRPAQAGVHRRRQRRQAAGRVPRDDPQGRAQGRARFVRQTGGKGSSATSIIDLEPTGPGGGYEFINKIMGGKIPRSTSRRSTRASRRRWTTASSPGTRWSTCGPR